MGTHRMGNDPKAAVVNWEQRSHDHPNLFLLGSGNFPTVGTANPTLTIAALALWAAKTISLDLSLMQMNAQLMRKVKPLLQSLSETSPPCLRGGATRKDRRLPRTALRTPSRSSRGA
mgnify:CR=1 FL=1